MASFWLNTCLGQGPKGGGADFRFDTPSAGSVEEFMARLDERGWVIGERVWSEKGPDRRGINEMRREKTALLKTAILSVQPYQDRR